MSKHCSSSHSRHDMMMNNNDITLQIITYLKKSNACALFCFNIVYYMNKIQNTCCLLCLTRVKLKFLSQTYFSGSSGKFSGKYFSGKATSLLKSVAMDLKMHALSTETETPRPTVTIVLSFILCLFLQKTK